MSVRRRAAWSVVAVVVTTLGTTGCVAEPSAAPATPSASASVPAAGKPAAAGKPDAGKPAAGKPEAGKPRAAGKPAARKPSPDAAAAEARKLLAARPAVVKGSDRERYTVRDVAVDDDGGRHARIDRTYRGLPVLGGDAVLHTGPDGHSNGATVAQSQRIDVGVKPAIGARRAESAAVKAYPGNRRERPARLVVDALDGKPVLAWEVGLQRYDVVVDATTGAVRRGVPVVHTAEPGTGHGLHSGEVPLSTRRSGDGFELVDPDRGGSVTRDALNRYYPAVEETVVLTDDDNVWGDGTMTDRATVAADVHYGVQQSWDFFRERYGRNGIADDGRGAVALTHYNGQEANASWSDSCQCMAFGDGDATAKAFTALDVVGHEMTHGITSATAGLVYWGESGGLNEASSDIFGTLVEFAAQNPADPADYLVGEQLDMNGVDGTPLRYMDDPAKDGKSQSCWTPELADLDVHYSSGVANKFFFMLAEGSGTSAYGTSPTCGGAPEVAGIGRDEAGAIWYRALTRYLVSNSNYASARKATLRAAADLHGASSEQYASVEAAWNAVGVDATRQLPQAPAVRSPGNLTAVVGQPVRVQIEATDAQDDDLTFTAEGLPDGLTMSADGLVTGAPTREYHYFTDFFVSDRDGNTSSVYATWETNGPPVFDPYYSKPRSNKIGDSVFEFVWADDRHWPLTWQITGLPDGVVHADPANSYMRGSPTTTGAWEVTATATDTTGMSATTTFTWTVVVDFVTSAPTQLAASRSGTDVTVTWGYPESPNWYTLTGWEVTAEPGGHKVTIGDWYRRTAVLPGLDPGTAYTVSVVAVNPGGRSPAATVEVP